MGSDPDRKPRSYNFTTTFFLSAKVQRVSTSLSFFLKETMVNHKKMVHPPSF